MSHATIASPGHREPALLGQTVVAALTVHIMTNTALTGATFGINGGQQLVEG